MIRCLTVVTPSAVGADLTTLAAVKDLLAVSGSDDDGFLIRTISQCSDAAARFCNRVFAVETVTETLLRRDDRGRGLGQPPSPSLQLSRWPVISVAAVFLDRQSLDPSLDLLIDAACGQLIRLDGAGQAAPWWGRSLVVTYRAGYVLPSDSSSPRTLPQDIEDAVCRLVAARWAERRRDPYLKVEETAGIRNEYWVPQRDTAFPPDVASLLDPYRVPVTG